MIQKKKISPNGPELSKLILGLWRLEDVSLATLEELIQTSLNHGISTIDQADIYGNYKSQHYFGKLLKEKPSLREKIQLVSKAGIHLGNSKFSKSGIGFYDSSKEHIFNSVHNSLKDLHTDYLDLLLIHRPDNLMNPQELDETFQELKQSGKVLHFGVSNFTPSQFDMLKSSMKTLLVTNQIEFSVLAVSPIFDGTFDNCIKNSISPMIWSPLAGGRLFTGDSEKVNKVKKVLFEIVKETGAIGIDQVALAWIDQHPSKPHTIIGTLKPERILSAVESQKLALSREQWYRILVASQGHPVP